MAIDRATLWLVILLGGFIVVGTALVLFDRFFLRTEKERDPAPALAAELGLEVRDDDASRQALAAAAAAFTRLLPAPDEIGAALVRQGPGHRLWVYEHGYRVGRNRSPGSTGVLVVLPVVLVEIETADQPYWHATASRDWIAALGARFLDGLEPLEVVPRVKAASADPDHARSLLAPEALERLVSGSEVLAAGSGRFVLFAPPPPASALAHAAGRQTSPDLVPSIGSSGFGFDVQRAVDFVNRMGIAPEPIARVKVIDVEPPRIEPRKIDLFPSDPDADAERERRAEEAAAERERRLEEIRLQGERSREEFRRRTERIREDLAGGARRDPAGTTPVPPFPAGKGSEAPAEGPEREP